MNDRHTLKDALDNQEECWSLLWYKMYNRLNHLISHTFLDLASGKDFTETITKQTEIILANIPLFDKTDSNNKILRLISYPVKGFSWSFFFTVFNRL